MEMAMLQVVDQWIFFGRGICRRVWGGGERFREMLHLLNVTSVWRGEHHDVYKGRVCRQRACPVNSAGNLLAIHLNTGPNGCSKELLRYLSICMPRILVTHEHASTQQHLDLGPGYL